MVDFLVANGIKLRRVASWPDYYDDRPGGSVPGRTVIADLFDTSELGAWRERLEPNFMKIPAYHVEGFDIALLKSSIRGRLAMLKVGMRMVMAKLTGKHWTSSGGALQGRMLQASLKAGVDLRINSPVRSFILDDKGAVKGVVTEKDGKPWRVGSRLGVLVNAGGFSHNQEMRDKYQPGTSAKWTAAPPGNTGEMILEMARIGAQLGQMEEMVGNQMSLPPGAENKGDGVDLGSVGGQMNITKPHSIVVDQSGVRYMNECGSYMEFCQNMLKRDKTVPAVPSWWIVDQKYMDMYMYTGTMAGIEEAAELVRQRLPQARRHHRRAGKPDIGRSRGAARHRRDSSTPMPWRASTANSAGASAPTTTGWATSTARTARTPWGRSRKAPFYAAPVVPGDVGTYGGVVTDVNARVLRADGSVIEGLYATGVSTASVMGRIYPGAGASVGPSFVFGWIAAKHAAGAGNHALRAGRGRVARARAFAIRT